MSMHTAYIAMGSNLGDSLRLLERAWGEIGNHLAIDLLSLASPYLSDPVGMESENQFVNTVGSVNTGLDPHELLAFLHETEKRFGRKRPSGQVGYADRTLDLDLLLYDDLVTEPTDSVIIPHPRMHERFFVLMPLCEIAPEFSHPALHRRVKELLADLMAGDEQPEMRVISWDETSDHRSSLEHER